MNIGPHLGKYDLRERLGYGGMAEVWKAFDPQLQRYVAIKLLHANLRDDPGFAARFQREAQFIANLRHPNIVKVHDFQISSPDSPTSPMPGTNAAMPVAYMVMDYVEGQTLATYIHNTSAKGHVPPPADILRLFASIASAVDYAHRNGTIHRDIKPANILLDARKTSYNPMGEPILTDFGVAKLMTTSAAALSAAQVGTPLYISPEQAQGQPGDERSDLYSLGVILYEILTGVTPFRGDSPNEVMMQQIHATPTSPAELNTRIPPALAQVVLRSLAKDPAARYPSASAMVVAMAEALHLPVPESSDASLHPVEPRSEATILMSQSSPRLQTVGPASSPAVTPLLSPLPRQATPLPTTPAAVSTPTLKAAATPVVTPLPSQPGIPPTPPPSQPRNRRRWLYIGLVALLIAAGAIAGIAYFTQNHTTPPVATANGIVGHAAFISSGNLNPGTAQGIADELKIDLQHIQGVPTGKSYYLWLLGDKNPIVSKADQSGPPALHVPLLLTNNLPVNNGNIDYTYNGVPTQHNNLLAVGSRLLVTEEDAGGNPSSPSTDRNTWRFYAEIPQAPIPNDPTSLNALIHIRHLFYNESSTGALGLPGGLDFWFLRNTQSVMGWATAARGDIQGASTSDGQIAQARGLFVRILDYMDGALHVNGDTPAGTPLLADPTVSKVALLTVHRVDTSLQYTLAHAGTDPPGLVDHIQLHVNQVVNAPDVTPDMRAIASRIVEATKHAKIWLMAAHDDITQLVAMTPEQLRGQDASTKLDDAVQQLTYAFIGQPDPVTNQVQSGVLQMHYDVQLLASFIVTNKVPTTL